MTPLVLKFLGSFIRTGMNLIVPVLVDRGIWTADEATEFTAAAILSGAALLWSLWEKRASYIAYLKALWAPAGASDQQVKDMPTPPVTLMGTPKLGLFLAIGLLGAASLTACAKVNPVLVAAEGEVYAAIEKVDGKLRSVCTDPTLAAPCADARPSMLELVRAGKAFSMSIAAQNIAGLGDVIAAGGRLAEQVKKLPDGQTVDIVRELARAISIAARQSKATD